MFILVIHTRAHTHTYISVMYKKFAHSFEDQIKTGKSAVELPAYPLAPLQSSILASCTGPLGGLCQLQPELDTATHDPGMCVLWGIIPPQLCVCVCV